MLDFMGHVINTVTNTRGHRTMQVNDVASSPLANYCVVDVTDDLHAWKPFYRLPLLELVRGFPSS